MNNFALLLAVMLPLAGSSAWADAGRSADLRYCLDMKSNDEIAKCAGEVSAGEKGKPLSRQEAEKILGKEITSAPINADKPSVTPANSDQPVEDLLLEKPERNGK